MTPRDLDDIKRFLSSVGKSTLFEYFGAPTDAPDDDVLAAIKKRRTWAQGQQSNPKYRQEALWVIKNVARCRRAMVDERLAYLEATRSASHKKELAVLDLFIQGNLTDGVLTDRGERAILQQGEAQGLPEHLVREHLEKVLTERGARRAGDSLTGPFVDHYGVLGVHPDAAINDLERAYRDRYHAARQLPDPREAERVYQELDAAWEVLRNPGTRARYDERRREELGPAAAAPAPAPASPTLAPSTTLEPSPAPATGGGRLRLGGADEEPSSTGLRLNADAAPKPPAGVKAGQTLGLSGGQSRPSRPRRAARLELDGPETMLLKVGRGGARTRFTVRKAGNGAMPGRVFVDREWVKVSPARLDADAAEQEIEITVDPAGMARPKAVALVTVVTDDGQRRSVTVEAEKTNPMPLIIAAGVLIVGAGAAVAVTQLDLGGSDEPAPPAGTLVVAVDPPAGQIFVNGDLVSTSGDARIDEGLPLGEPLRIRVEQDGFATWAGETTLRDGEESRVEVDLELTDKMDWAPSDEDVRAEVPSAQFARALGERNRYIDGCYHKHLVDPEPGFLALTTVSANVSSRGWVVGVRFEEENHPTSEPLRLCLKRQLRSIKLPIFTGDYAVVKHQFRYTVPGTPAPK
jgi:hypothetical protein